MKQSKLAILVEVFFLFSSPSWAQPNSALRQQLQRVAATTNGVLGVGVIDLSNGDTVSVNGQGHFPMQSVYKFHLALAVMNEIDKGKWTLEQKIKVTKKDLLPNTWSPLREKYPNGEVELPLREILEYTVAQSDNNGCDILFRLMGGTKVVDKYIKSIGISDVNIVGTEEEMHADDRVQFANWSTPRSAAKLLAVFFEKKILSKHSWDFVWNTMVSTTTGPRKIKGVLPANATVAHKTGYSGVNKQGIIVATNDIGIMQLPNGKYVAIAVFLSNTPLPEAQCDRVIAEAAKVTWDYFLTK
ncbi:class A beta-lactamase, subclass A2 [Runella limosa]|uniref:class A beta-lactamase, subclass A2 n=1 Tax=Runella limosa TaxID=370978 RepID=UPI00041CE8F3|nr:class A beta-lactamase, subclass A2 [Runella limosa]